MRGTRSIVCTVLLGALGAGALAAAAGAAAPEFKVCGKAVKVAGKDTGTYTDKSCTKEATEQERTEGRDNKYERLPWTAAKKQSFKGKVGVTLLRDVDPHGKDKGGPGEPGQSATGASCKKGKAAGSVTGPREEVFKLEWQSCTWPNPQLVHPEACETPGTKGTIVTEELAGTLVYLSADHSRVGMRVKGLGPGGRVLQYTCAGEAYEVFGELLLERSGDINTTGAFETSASEGTLALQSNLYEEEAFSEETGKAALEWESELGRCEKGEPPYPAGTRTQSECEEQFIGSQPPPPISLIEHSHSLGQQPFPSTGPEVLVSSTALKGEKALMVEAS